MLALSDVFSLTDFLRNHKDLVTRSPKAGKPTVLTVKGKLALIIQDPDSYQDLLDRLTRAETAREI